VTGRRPSVVLVDADALPAQLERARNRGRAQTNFDLPDDPWMLDDENIICLGTATEEATTRIVLAALRGVDLVVALPDAAWTLPLVRDLDRIATVGTGQPAADDPADLLNDDQRELLGLLASGMSIPEAAGELYLSIRTAERRLGAARRLLGTRTTAEAVLLVGTGR